MGASDLLIAAGVLSLAGWIIYRSLWRSRGRCGGCAGCGTTTSAPVSPRPPRRPAGAARRG